VPRRLALVVAATLLIAGLAGSAAPRGEARTAYGLRLFLNAGFGVAHVAAPASGGSKLYVVQQNGRVRLAVKGKLQAKPFLDIRKLVSFGGERGLFSIAFHPAWARNRLFYVDYYARNGHTKVVEYRANKAGTLVLPKSARVLLDVAQPGPEHNGGQLAFGPDGKLYVAFGDGECCDDPQNRAQDFAQPFGKLLRIDVAARPSRAVVAALGLRNPWRFSFDRATGDLYVADVGAGLWEEIDYLPRAELSQLVNYGWDVYEGHVFKEEKPPAAQGRLVFPIHVYGHDVGCSVTGGYVYRGTAVPEARGRYFFGDYCSNAVWSLRVENGAATDVRREPFTIPELSTFGEDARGELYAASHSGRVYKLAR
jgi:glucose/arabinose dehydrogenase